MIDFTAAWTSRMMDNYGTPRIELVKGEGPWLTDSEGKRYLDLLAGIAVNVLGHGNPAIVDAVSKQVAELGHVSNIFASEPPLKLAEKLIELTGWGAEDTRVMFCNSGTEANEAAFKLARMTGRRRIIATNHGFHGRTMGALAIVDFTTNSPICQRGDSLVVLQCVVTVIRCDIAAFL